MTCLACCITGATPIKGQMTLHGSKHKSQACAVESEHSCHTISERISTVRRLPQGELLGSYAANYCCCTRKGKKRISIFFSWTRLLKRIYLQFPLKCRGVSLYSMGTHMQVREVNTSLHCYVNSDLGKLCVASLAVIFSSRPALPMKGLQDNASC